VRRLREIAPHRVEHRQRPRGRVDGACIVAAGAQHRCLPARLARRPKRELNGQRPLSALLAMVMTMIITAAAATTADRGHGVGLLD